MEVSRMPNIYSIQMSFLNAHILDISISIKFSFSFVPHLSIQYICKLDYLTMRTERQNIKQIHCRSMDCVSMWLLYANLTIWWFDVRRFNWFSNWIFIEIQLEFDFFNRIRTNYKNDEALQVEQIPVWSENRECHGNVAWNLWELTRKPSNGYVLTLIH